MSIYQDIRPKSFDEVVGNKAVVASLKKAVSATHRQHTYLFTGPSGCGKTTLARIFAKAVGCGEVDIVEINAASNRGIDAMRKLEEAARYSGLSGGARCVILDECHALTKDAQNAILKVLEDAPEHQYYCLCSTDPQKIIPTIRTRCDTVEVKALTNKEMEDLLSAAIIKAEIPDPDDDVFFAIIDAAKGCPRTALVLLEKQNGMEIKDALEVIQSYEGGTKEVIDLCRAIIGGKWSEAKRVYKAMVETDAEKVRYAVLGYTHACLLGADGNKAERFAGIIEVFSPSVMYSQKGGLLGMIYKATKKRSR